jgi:hypothetical protein
VTAALAAVPDPAIAAMYVLVALASTYTARTYHPHPQRGRRGRRAWTALAIACTAVAPTWLVGNLALIWVVSLAGLVACLAALAWPTHRAGRRGRRACPETGSPA